MKKLTILLLLLVLSLGSKIHAQETKYVVVPIQFDFLKGRDQFRANSLLRYLFKENGYKAYFDVEDLPEDLFQDRCKAIYSDVKKIGGGLNIKVQIEIKDCRGNLLFLSDIGKSKEKDLNKGYKLAIEEAFESFKAVNVTSEADELDVLIAQEEKTAHEQQGQVTGINETTGGVATTSAATKTLNPSATSNTEANSNETLFAKPSEDGGVSGFYYGAKSGYGT